MTREEAAAALQRALEISRELAAITEHGDVRLAVSLDAQRLELLQSVRIALLPLDPSERAVISEIAELTDRSLGRLQHRFRAKCRDLDMLAVGKRAVRAYGNTRR